MTADIVTKKETAFVLWRVTNVTQPPSLVIAQLKEGTPVFLINKQNLVLQQYPDFPDLWLIPANACHLADDQVYHYWFEVNDCRSGHEAKRICITDPFAYMVDWRVLASKPEGPAFKDEDRYPAAVILYKDGKLLPYDSGGEQASLSNDADVEQLPLNNKMVIYEIPTAWMHTGTLGERQVGVGSFCDVTALIDGSAAGLNFTELSVTEKGRQYLVELGINAIELLPPADSYYNREWGYGTTNFFAPDADLGTGPSYSWPAPNRDLQALVRTCHNHGIRFFVDSVTAFARTNAYLAAAFDDFFMADPADGSTDPEAYNSRLGHEKKLRNGYGNTLFRYDHFVNSYDPVSGEGRQLSPARQLMKAAILHWVNHFHIDGIRMDSIENVASWNFVKEYKDIAKQAWLDRFPAQADAAQTDARFLVVGEELQEPLELLIQQRLDGLWHERFKIYVRKALTGQKADEEVSFEDTVRKLIDCRQFGYTDMSEAIIYLTSHDVGDNNDFNMRLYNFLQRRGVYDTERRIKLGFVCLLTAAGIPMILAGEEFADQHDLFNAQGNVDNDNGKQIDPVNFSREENDWRKRIKEYVSSLVKLRTGSEALAMNETSFIHTDFSDGKRVLAWVRGNPASGSLVVVVANFSDFGTDISAPLTAEYKVYNWPFTPAGKTWKEITQNRAVPAEWVGREPVFPWEAKVYALS